MDDDLVRDGRYARLDLRGARTGSPRRVTVGFVEWPDGTLVVAARGETAWSTNLVADPVATVTVGVRTFAVTAELLEPGDPLRAAAIRDLILRYGTPSERLGTGPVFRLRPMAPGPE
ncbi:MAG TPA: nitroreductase family deazaflavin-dependent oxidoreductase [Candidatus Limnocylindrales bacterium]|jgi:deazaflavin-dependent oxidoreductase (nitroreductase family)